MIKRKIFWVAALLSMLIFVGFSGAARPSGSGFVVTSYDYQTPVEQQTPSGASQPDQSLWVVNPTRLTQQACIWDWDDYMNFSWSGTLNPGQSVSWSSCILADWADHVSWIRSGSTGVTATITVSNPDGTVSRSGQVACVLGPAYHLESRDPLVFSSKLQSVAGSNGGYAVFTTVTYTFTNTGSHKLHLASGDGGMSDRAPCTTGPMFGYDPSWAASS